MSYPDGASRRPAPSMPPSGSLGPTSLPTISLHPRSAEAAPAGRGPRPWLPLAVVALATVLGVGAGLAWVLLRPRAVDAGEAVVRTYLTALADGRAEDALAAAAPLPAGDRSWLTDAVLAATHQSAPVTPPSQVRRIDATTVAATWQQGPRQVTQLVEVTAGAQPRVARAATQVSFPQALSSVPVVIAGRPVLTPSLLLFPGDYRLATATGRLTYGTGVLSVGTDRPSIEARDLVLTPTPEGIEDFASLTEAGLQACLAQVSLAPVGCPFSYVPESGERLDGATITWSLPGGMPPLPALDVTDPTEATTTVAVAATVVIAATSADGPVRHEVAATLRPRMDLTQTRPRVSWG